MNRYIVVVGLPGHSSHTGPWLVVDLQAGVGTDQRVQADCGTGEFQANKIAQALNALDGGPL